MTDLVPTGETFTATEAQVTHLLHPKVGPPRIRKIEEQKEPLPFILPRHVTDLRIGPPAGVRPDPVGSSEIIERIPEMTEPSPDSETKAEEDTVDIPPRRARAGARASVG